MITLEFALFIILVAVVYIAVRGLFTFRRLRELGGFIEELAKGNLEKRLYLKGKHGFPRIMTNLSILAANLQDRIKEAEELRRRMDVLMKSTPDGIILVDSKNRIKTVNPSLEGIFNVKGAGISGRRLAEALNVTGLNKLIGNARENGAGKSEIFTIDSKYISVSAFPFSGPQEHYAGSVLVARDITAEKRIDEIRRDFVANVSHELKTPVTAIKGFAETLLDGALDNREDSVRFLNTIKFQSERMEQLIKDLIVLSKIEFGAVPIEKKAVSLPGIVDNVFSLFEEKASSKGLYLKKDIECDSIDADPERLMQILVNLLDNAIKYTDSGGLIIRAREADNWQCVLTVSDTGIGVPKKYISRLGERFFRVDPSRSRELGGTGLGLAIVKHLILAQGWKMHIDSDLGKGTSVRIYIK
ncbi:MAG: ATP-binding protein [Nitrospiraceae bacterium]|nr:ATP-binding protein [Nitrospiraceae bacterium]